MAVSPENSHHDTNEDTKCRTEASVNGTGPQFLDFEAVIWGPAPGEIRELHPLPGDTVGMALGINDEGEAVGVSGTCANTVLPGFVAGPHAVLWDKDGAVHDLGSFGGTSNPSMLAVGNASLAINNKGEVVGTSAMPDSLVNQPFMWTNETGMQHLPLLFGDVVGAGLAINSQGDVVGASISPGGANTGTPTAVLWREGVVNDLNDLAADSPLQLLTACAINDGGEIGGFGFEASTGEIHAFMATPCGVDPRAAACQDNERVTTAKMDESSERPRLVLPENARKVFLRLGLGGR